MIKPLLGILTERTMPGETFHAFCKIVGQGWDLVIQPPLRTDLARHRMAEELLRGDHTHLIMLDCDHNHPADIVQRLCRWVDDDATREVVAGLTFRRCEPHDPLCFIRNGDNWYAPTEWPTGLWQVNAVGTGAICIARTVFERIPQPWFYYDYSNVEHDAWPTEDLAFCARCTDANIKIWVDTTTVSPHMGMAWIDEKAFRDYLKKETGNGRTDETPEGPTRTGRDSRDRSPGDNHLARVEQVV
jgi:hypothetical protein